MIEKLFWLILSFLGIGVTTPEMINKIIVPEEIKLVPIMVETTPTPTLTPKRITTRLPTKTITPTEPWGVAKQIDEVTWTMKITNDERMTTAKELVEALNEYRKRRGVQPLTWDDKLAELAQMRADEFDKLKSTDKHEGFKKYMDDNGFEKLGFTWVGENSSYGYRLLGVHLIEWIFAGDKPHDDNQTNSRWNYVGVGIKGLGVDIIFGTGRSR